MRNSITGFLLSLMVAYFIRLWALENGHSLLSLIAAVYMFVLLLPFALTILVLVFVAVFLFISYITKGKKMEFKPFWLKNRTWTR